MRFRERFIGTKDFYRHTMTIALPIMIQNGITTFVSMLDNIMIGQVGTDQMSGVAIVNQLLFVWNLCVFGGLSGIGIFTAQFYGKGDKEGIRYTMRLMFYMALALIAAGLLILTVFADPLIMLYLHEDGSAGDVAATFAYAKQYLFVLYFLLPPFALSQIYATTLRTTSDTLTPMQSGLIAVFINLIGNYILIFGKLGLPAMGVTGAALATVISRFVELLYLIVRTHRRPKRYPFIVGVWSALTLPVDLAKRCLAKGMPLLMNEALWASGQAVLLQNYSLRGLSVVAAYNISSTVVNVFNISFIALGSAISIVVGQQLGAGYLEQAKKDAPKHILFSVCVGTVAGLLLAFVSGLYPLIYNTTADVREIATGLIRISVIYFPMHSALNSCYFILRSGGKTFITFLFDSCFSWVVIVPVTFALMHFTALTILPAFAIVEGLNLLKAAIGFVLIRRGVWVQNITSYIEG